MTGAARGVGRRWSIAAAAAMVVAVAFGGSAAASTPTRWDHNLVKDPGAEAAQDVDDNGGDQVAIPGWDEQREFTAATYHPNTFGYPNRHESQRINGGTNFFVCGPDSEGTAQQVIKLVGRNGPIDAGKVRLRLAAWISSYDSQGDKARVKVWALDASDLVIGTLKTGWVTSTGDMFVHKSKQMTLPAGTRKLEVVLEGQRNGTATDSYCDAYFDNIDVRIQKVA